MEIPFQQCVMDALMGALPAGVPASAVTDMYASGVNAKLLEVTDKQLGDINHIANSWFRFEIPANTYPRQAEKVKHHCTT